MNAFFIALNAVVPFLIYIAYGYIARITGMVSEDFMQKWSRICFKLFFFFVMFHSFYAIDPSMEIDIRFFTFSAVFLIGLILVMCVLVPHFIKDRKQIPVVIQAIFRSNAVLFAMPLSENVVGPSAVAYCAMILALIIPIYNIASVLIFEKYTGTSHGIKGLIISLLKNPMILGAIAGTFFLVTQIRLPASVYKSFTAFSDLATPLALLTLGGTLHFDRMTSNKKILGGVIFIKLVVTPAIVLALSTLIGLGMVERFVVFTVFATPAATASFPLSVAMGGDGELAGEIVVLSTVLAVVTLFLWIFFMASVGLI